MGFEEADKYGFWEESKKEMKRKMDRFNEVFDELALPVRFLQKTTHKSLLMQFYSTLIQKVAILSLLI